MILGICGKSGSGKSTLSNIISLYYDSKYIDIDKIGHLVLTIDEVKDELIYTFGEIVVNDGLVNRKRLGDLVFNSREKMDRLTQITWKYMEKEIDFLIKHNSNKILILDWILLPKTKYYDMCDKKILLDIPFEIRKERAMKRDNISSEAFDLREKASIDFNLEDFDYVLNDNNEETIKRLVKSL